MRRAGLNALNSSARLQAQRPVSAGPECGELFAARTADQVFAHQMIHQELGEPAPHTDSPAGKCRGHHCRVENDPRSA